LDARAHGGGRGDARLRSDANHEVKMARWALAKARRPKLPLDEATGALARAEQHHGECRARVAHLVEEKGSDDRTLARQAARGEREVVDALLDAEVALEIARETVRDGYLGAFATACESRWRSSQSQARSRARLAAAKLHAGRIR
jgi:hypothetical protein